MSKNIPHTLQGPARTAKVQKWTAGAEHNVSVFSEDVQMSKAHEEIERVITKLSHRKKELLSSSQPQTIISNHFLILGK